MIDKKVMAYADPPYIGQAKKRYGNQPEYRGEVDHHELARRLVREYPDGWALSCSSVSLEEVIECLRAAGLSQRQGDYRVMAWVKPFCAFKPGVNPAYAWEPVIVSGGRKRGRDKPTVRDWVSVNITLKKGLCGAKPEDFCRWLFEVLGLEPHDDLHDLFPGTGIVTRCWEEWRASR